MIRTVFFDLDGTLYDYDKAHAAGFRVLSDFAAETLGVQPEAFRALHREAMTEQERRMGYSCGSIHNRIIRYQIILELSGNPISHALRMSNLYWDTFLDTVTPYPGAADCLRTLRKHGYRVGIGTNMTADYQFIKLDRLGLLDQIDFMLSSEEEGVEKPDRRFFARCVEKAGCSAAECAFVGDNPVHDAAGAIAAGMRGVWFRPEGGGAGDAPEIPASAVIPREAPPEAADAPRISSLIQLPDLLAGM